MTDKPPLIDTTFGLSQLSGNVELYTKMLGKFTQEYQNTSQQLINLLQNEDIQSAKRIVHTAKGITGNLGLMALYESSNAIDAQLKNLKYEPAVLTEFTDTLEATLTAIDELSLSMENDVVATSLPQQEDSVIAELTALVQRQEFVDSAYLLTLLEQTNLSEANKLAFIAAVEEMRFDDATRILESS